ncbi:hypothetical protein [Alicyclobacillus sp. SO9]|uniref:hypothetical protein n=1 Tax=Alicyclobacillus sp. SO9 TaxID=2665646 RepID=UPI0018E87E83|nr:hypothetical protein [Alicyclobacillus sp. SO9]QQE79570.1 hypothetical protein GI364_03480 [Alicyclobacillus sp. SO9]QQE79575.1 hypothetical protein GI364_03510 [Alicyclobacillus sp. SO9]
MSRAGISMSQGFFWSKPKNVNELDELEISLEAKRFSMYRLNLIENRPIQSEMFIEKSREVDHLISLIMRREDMKLSHWVRP